MSPPANGESPDRIAPEAPRRRFARWARPFRAAVWVWIAATAILLVGLAALAVQTARGLHETRAESTREITRAEEALKAIPLLDADDIATLRRSRNDVHVALADSLGIRPPATLAALPPGLVRVDTLRAVMALDGEHSDPVLTPDGAAALRLVGDRFAAALQRQGIPPFRPVATSLLRSVESQTALRGVNVNAAAGHSSHEYGTTFDLSYRRFRLPHAPVAVSPRVPAPFRALARRAVGADAARERLAADYPSRLDAILGRVLARLEDEGAVVVVRERNQTVYHVTAARHVAAPAD